MTPSSEQHCLVSRCSRMRALPDDRRLEPPHARKRARKRHNSQAASSPPHPIALPHAHTTPILCAHPVIQELAPWRRSYRQNSRRSSTSTRSTPNASRGSLIGLPAMMPAGHSPARRILQDTAGITLDALEAPQCFPIASPSGWLTGICLRLFVISATTQSAATPPTFLVVRVLSTTGTWPTRVGAPG